MWHFVSAVPLYLYYFQILAVSISHVYNAFFAQTIVNFSLGPFTTHRFISLFQKKTGPNFCKCFIFKYS